MQSVSSIQRPCIVTLGSSLQSRLTVSIHSLA